MLCCAGRLDKVEIMALFFPLFQALGESLGRGDDHYDMDIITKFLKVTGSNYSVVVPYYCYHADTFLE